jgi:hypothetical protein
MILDVIPVIPPNQLVPLDGRFASDLATSIAG